MGMTTAVIAGASAIIAGGLSAVASYQRNNTEKDILASQMDYQTREREAAQEYNSAENQRKRYEAAGINPYLAMSNLTPGSAEAQTSPGLPQLQNVDYSQMLNGLTAGVDQYKQIQEAEQMQLGTEMMRVDARAKIAEKILELQDKRQQILNSKMDLRTKQQELKNLSITGEQLQQDLRFTTQTFNERKASIVKNNKLMDLDAKAKDLQNSYQQMVNDLQPLQRRILSSTISNIQSSTSVNKARSAEAYANEALLFAEKSLKKQEERGVKIENYHKRNFYRIVRKTAKEEYRAKKWDADHPSYFDKFILSGVQELNDALDGRKRLPGSSPVFYNGDNSFGSTR